MLAALGAAAGPAAAAELPPCGTIRTASVTLTGDCAAPLTIAKTGARVDLAGHRVTCTAQWEGDWEEYADTRRGIVITDRRAVRVTNGIVSGCGRGIYITGGRSHRLTGLRVSDNGGAVSDASAAGTGAGIVIDGSAHNLVADSRILENGGPGIKLVGAADRNRIVGNTLEGNIGSVDLGGGYRNYVDANTIRRSTGEGTPAIEGGLSSVIRWNRIADTRWRYDGVGINAGANAIVRENHVTGSGVSGIQVWDPGIVIGNTVSGNGTFGWGCGIELGAGALVTQNTVIGNGAPGSDVDGICATGGGNRIRLNVTSGNSGVDLRDWTGCLANLWQYNAFTTRFPDCIS